MNRSSLHKMYYIAVVCPGEINDKILHYKNWMKQQFDCIVALKSPAHITLIPPFWLDAEREQELQQAVQSFPAINEFGIQLDGFSHFTNRVLFINVRENAELGELKQQAELHFIPLFPGVIKKDERPFHPHITIANRDMKPGHFVKAWQHFSGKNFQETFSVKTISLLRLMPGKWEVIGESTGV